MHLFVQQIFITGLRFRAHWIQTKTKTFNYLFNSTLPPHTQAGVWRGHTLQVLSISAHSPAPSSCIWKSSPGSVISVFCSEGKLSKEQKRSCSRHPVISIQTITVGLAMGNNSGKLIKKFLNKGHLYLLSSFLQSSFQLPGQCCVFCSLLLQLQVTVLEMLFLVSQLLLKLFILCVYLL